MSEMQTIHWFPGHMAKATLKIEESIKLVDVVLEVIDSKIPVSSKNPDINKITGGKPRITIFNKSDLADPAETDKWIRHYKEQGLLAVPLDCKSGAGVDKFYALVKNVLKDKVSLWKQKGFVGRHIKAMVVGIPNVGKSTFINKLSNKTKAKAENRPGVTRQNQWFSVAGKIDLLDTPGVLWPKFNDETIGINLALTGAIKETVIDVESLAFYLLKKLLPRYSKNLSQRFKISEEMLTRLTEYDCLKEIGKRRGMLISGGEVDLYRVSTMLLDEFKRAKFGRITLERVD